MQLSEKACRIKLLAMDVDGVLTDGSLFYTSNGEEIKVFNVKDGMGITLSHHAGLEIALITGRRSGALEIRASQLKIKHLQMGVPDKVAVLKKLAAELDISDSEIGFIGDDLNDLSALRWAGFAVTVPGSPSELIEMADYITQHEGGRGAVREVIELILKSQGRWEVAVSAVQGNTGQ